MAATDADDLVARMLVELEERMTSAGHRAMLANREHRGHCPHNGDAPGCVRLRGLIAEAERYLAERQAAQWLESSPMAVRGRR